jgi:CheY-like chemotaxis protein
MDDPRPLKILLVEDEPDIQAISQIALETVGGFRVEIANSGQEGLEKARASAPDLILMDYMMPGMDGPATLQELRRQTDTRDIPVVFVTAKVQPQEIAYLRSLGARGVIPKPFDPMKLASAVRSILEGRHESRSVPDIAGRAS